MKSILSVLLIILASCSSKLSERNIPEAVLRSFKSRFNIVDKVNWEKEKEWFEAEFRLNGIKTSALYDDKGKLLELESGITTDQLPKPVSNSLNKQFSEYKIKEVSKIESDQPLIYEVELTKDKKEMEIFFSSEGEILKEIRN